MKNEESNTKIIENQYIPTAEFYSQVIDCLQDYAVFTLDKELVINSWNSGATKLFQYETGDIIGKHFDIIFTEEDKKNDVPNVEIAKALNDGRASDNRWHICKDGSKFYAYGLVYPLTREDGEMIGYVKILRDLTERKKSEKFAKDIEDLSLHKESILFVLSHDFRSLLTSIIGTAKYLRSNIEKMKQANVKEMLDVLYQTSNDELNLLDYLVEWARLKYASEAFAPVNVELSKCVNKVFEELNENAVANNIRLHNNIEEDVCVFADGELLLSIFQNLISNAIKHISSGGEITVAAKRSEAKVIIEIKDTGIGMSEEIQRKLFTPQITSISNRGEYDKGVGIGLLLAKGFVEKNGGEIWVESTEGKGSSFYFTLPVSKPSPGN